MNHGDPLVLELTYNQGESAKGMSRDEKWCEHDLQILHTL